MSKASSNVDGQQVPAAAAPAVTTLPVLAPLVSVDASTAEKVRQTFLWILAGACEHDVRQAIEASWPGSKPQTLITAAVKKMSAAAESDPQIVRGFAIEATRDLYRRMLEIGDFVGALRAVKQLNDLAGR